MNPHSPQHKKNPTTEITAVMMRLVLLWPEVGAAGGTIIIRRNGHFEGKWIKWL